MDNLRFGTAGQVVIPAVPEPASWAMMIGGFGVMGAAVRYRRREAKVSFA
ncbi:MAG: PEPxxWA-CTERM sorting domain-containing protein [Beijerinckiaceae bacterium]|nr:PEPxxWA-CTERM sorting domain-containing protein [Beijerinckiaceae bacterium]